MILLMWKLQTENPESGLSGSRHFSSTLPFFLLPDVSCHTKCFAQGRVLSLHPALSSKVRHFLPIRFGQPSIVTPVSLARLTCPACSYLCRQVTPQWWSLFTGCISAPLRFQSPRLSPWAKCVAGQSQRKIVAVVRSVLQLKHQVSSKVLNPPLGSLFIWVKQRNRVQKALHSKLHEIFLMVRLNVAHGLRFDEIWFRGKKAMERNQGQHVCSRMSLIPSLCQWQVPISEFKRINNWNNQHGTQEKVQDKHFMDPRV